MTLSHDERRRYKRHLLLPEIGGQGQKALGDARVLVVGMGGLGCPIASYLVAAGVGRVGLCDGDVVEMSNLQRQTLYTTPDIGKLKVEIAATRLKAINPGVTFVPHAEFLKEENALGIVREYDIVVEGLDRFAPRYVVNAACIKARSTLISAAIGRFDGQVAMFEPGRVDAPCYACLVPEPPTDEAACEAEGVLGAVPGVVGSLAAMETIKLICGMNSALRHEMLIFEGLAGQMRRVTLTRDPQCPACGPRAR